MTQRDNIIDLVSHPLRLKRDEQKQIDECYELLCKIVAEEVRQKVLEAAIYGSTAFIRTSIDENDSFSVEILSLADVYGSGETTISYPL